MVSLETRVAAFLQGTWNFLVWAMLWKLWLERNKRILNHKLQPTYAIIIIYKIAHTFVLWLFAVLEAKKDKVEDSILVVKGSLEFLKSLTRDVCHAKELIMYPEFGTSWRGFIILGVSSRAPTVVHPSVVLPLVYFVMSHVLCAYFYLSPTSTPSGVPLLFPSLSFCVCPLTHAFLLCFFSWFIHFFNLIN